MKAQQAIAAVKEITRKTFYGFSRDFLCKLFAVNRFDLEDPGTVFDLIQVV